MDIDNTSRIEAGLIDQVSVVENHQSQSHSNGYKTQNRQRQVEYPDIMEKSCKAKTNDKDKGEECPLFMSGLPNNFASNSGLAAIASFLGDEVSEEIEEQKNQDKSQSRGNKAGKRILKKASSLKKCSPYQENLRKEKRKGTTIEEAQLYLSMWGMS